MLNANFKDPYYINIFTHLIILIKRLRNRSKKAVDESPIKHLAEFKNGKALESARYTIQKISDYIRLKVPEIEIFYLYQYLISSGIETPESNYTTQFELKGSKEKQLTMTLIQMISTKLGINFMPDLPLRHSLFLHIQSLIKRVRYDILICNPLLEEIKNEFPSIFQTVQQSILEQTIFPEFKNLSEDEIGYIAVYFQVSLEKRTLHKKVMIVCSSGVGTSHLLSTRVKRAFPEWEIVDIVSANRIGQIEHPEQIDFILTTVHLNAQQIPTILVSAIFSEVDILKVKNMIHSRGC